MPWACFALGLITALSSQAFLGLPILSCWFGLVFFRNGVSVVLSSICKEGSTWMICPLYSDHSFHIWKLPLFSVIRPVGRSWLVKVGFSSSRCSGLPSEGDLRQRSRRFHIANWECDPRLWAWCKDPATSVSRDWDSCFSPLQGLPAALLLFLSCLRC